MPKKHRVVLLPEAAGDKELAISWLRAENAKLPQRFRADLRDALIRIADNPQASSIRYDEIRIRAFRIFSYGVHYTVDEPQHLVIVTGIHHTSINPDRWQRPEKI